MNVTIHQLFPGCSASKESTCNTGDPGSIPGLGRSPGEGIGYPTHYPWASMVAQMVKNLPIMRQTWVRCWGCEDPLEEGMATHPSVLAWRIPWTEEPGGRGDCLPMHETQEMRVQSLGQEDPLEKEMATHSSILSGEFHAERSLLSYSPWHQKESDVT